MRFPVCWKENFAGLKTHRKRGKSARASPTPHHTLHEERTARFTAQPLSALVTNIHLRFSRWKMVRLVAVTISPLIQIYRTKGLTYLMMASISSTPPFAPAKSSQKRKFKTGLCPKLHNRRKLSWMRDDAKVAWQKLITRLKFFWTSARLPSFGLFRSFGLLYLYLTIDFSTINVWNKGRPCPYISEPFRRKSRTLRDKIIMTALDRETDLSVFFCAQDK